MSKISNRVSTLTYEVSKALAKVPHAERCDEEQCKKKLELLGCDIGRCVYCNAALCGNKTNAGDHFYPMVKGGRPTEYCDDFWNIVPCCQNCNSCKGGKSFWEWTKEEVIARSRAHPYKLKTPEQLEEVIHRFRSFDEYATTRRYKKAVPLEQFDAISAKIKEALAEIVRDTEILATSVKYTRQDEANCDRLTAAFSAKCTLDTD